MIERIWYPFLTKWHVEFWFRSKVWHVAVDIRISACSVLQKVIALKFGATHDHKVYTNNHMDVVDQGLIIDILFS